MKHVNIKKINKKKFTPTPKCQGREVVGEFLNNQKGKSPQSHGRNPMVWGFTLIELMVALAIFLVVLAITISIFLIAVKSQREAFKAQDIQDNARYLGEAMIKELRMSQIISFDSYNLTVKNQDGVTISYQFDNSNNRVRKYDASFPGGVQDISAAAVKTWGEFFVMNGVYDQPRVTISLRVYPTNAASPEVRIQSTVALRKY